MLPLPKGDEIEPVFLEDNILNQGRVIQLMRLSSPTNTAVVHPIWLGGFALALYTFTSWSVPDLQIFWDNGWALSRAVLALAVAITALSMVNHLTTR